MKPSGWVLTRTICLALAAPAICAGQVNPSTAADWQRVDALRPGTRIVVTLKTGEVRTGGFRATTADDLTIDTTPPGASAENPPETLPKSLIRRIATHDPLSDGMGKGALAGAGGMLTWVAAGIESCGTGCESGSWLVMGLATALAGAGIGTIVGLAADLDAGGSQVLFPPGPDHASAHTVRRSRFFPSHPAFRAGPTYTRTSFLSPLIQGTAGAPGFAAAVQLSPRISVHVEYTAMDGQFSPSPGSVPDEVLQNVVPATIRLAGWSKGIESRRVSYRFSELVGVSPSPWGRLRVQCLAGLGVQGQENRDYYDAARTTPQGKTEHLPGKYYVLDFQTPELGVVLGLDAEIAVARHLVAVPMLRYSHMGDPGPSMAYGVAAYWRF